MDEALQMSFECHDSDLDGAKRIKELNKDHKNKKDHWFL
jgi:hypothetical protein